MWPNMMCLASSSMSVLKVNLSFSAIARAAAGRAERHVDDGVGVADHITAVGELVVEDLVMAMSLELVAVVRVFQILRCKMLEVHGLS